MLVLLHLMSFVQGFQMAHEFQTPERKKGEKGEKRGKGASRQLPANLTPRKLFAEDPKGEKEEKEEKEKQEEQERQKEQRDARDLKKLLQEQTDLMNKQITTLHAWVMDNTHEPKDKEHLEKDKLMRSMFEEALAKLEFSINTQMDACAELDKTIRESLPANVEVAAGLGGLELDVSLRLREELHRALAIEPSSMPFEDMRKRADELACLEAAMKKGSKTSDKNGEKKGEKEKKKPARQPPPPELDFESIMLFEKREKAANILYTVARMFDLKQQENAMGHHLQNIFEAYQSSIKEGLDCLVTELTLLNKLAAARTKWIKDIQKAHAHYTKFKDNPKFGQKAKKQVERTIGFYLEDEAQALAKRKQLANVQHLHIGKIVSACLQRSGLKEWNAWRDAEIARLRDLKDVKPAGRTGSSSSSRRQAAK